MCGDTLLDKRRYARDHLDHLRRALMFEPRGHKDMYGAILVEKDADKADLAVLFIHCEGALNVLINAELWCARKNSVPLTLLSTV